MHNVYLIADPEGENHSEAVAIVNMQSDRNFEQGENPKFKQSSSVDEKAMRI